MSDQVQEPESFSIGAIFGGRTRASEIWKIHILALMNEVAETRSGIHSDLNLNVEFQVPGHLLAPDFEGVRSAAFRKKDSLLKIQVAVPAEVSESPRETLISFLWKAIDAADAWAVRRKFKFDSSPLREFVGRVESTG